MINFHFFVNYFLLLLFFLLFFLFITIKLCYPFWNIQPVYHSYDFWRVFYRNPFIIHKTFSEKWLKTKFCNRNIETTDYQDIDENTKTEVIEFLQCHTIQTENSLFLFQLDHLNSYLCGHLFPSYLSIYRFPLTNNHQPIVGLLTGRSGKIYINNQHENIYYLDYLCVHREHHLVKTTRELIQTHIYNQMWKDSIYNSSKKGSQHSSIMVSIFRKDKELLSGIVPVVSFTTNYYKLVSFMNTSIKFREHMLLTEIKQDNIHLMFDFLEKIRPKFSLFGISDNGCLYELIKSNLLYVFVLHQFSFNMPPKGAEMSELGQLPYASSMRKGVKQLDEVYAIYFFRDIRTQYDETDDFQGPALQLCGSITNGLEIDMFYKGYLKALQQILHTMPFFKILMMDVLGDNEYLASVMGSVQLVTQIKSSYYLYNMVVPCSPNSSSQTFLLL